MRSNTGIGLDRSQSGAQCECYDVELSQPTFVHPLITRHVLHHDPCRPAPNKAGQTRITR